MISNNRRTPKPKILADHDGEWEQIALHANKTSISPSVYKGEATINKVKRPLVREELIEIYHGKCAYCESKEMAPEVEHYRPKKRVYEDNNHPGYYWLCYEWTNLLPSCRYCNTSGGKVDHFPIMGSRLYDPPIQNGKFIKANCDVNHSDLMNERPYLLHPEVDEPEKCIRFNRDGLASGIDKSGRGNQTIEICNLNRDNLIYHRKQIVDNLLQQVEDQFTLYFQVNQQLPVLRSGLEGVFTRLDQKCNDDIPFSSVSRNIRANIAVFVANQLKTPIQRDFTITIYNEYRANNFI